MGSISQQKKDLKKKSFNGGGKDSAEKS